MPDKKGTPIRETPGSQNVFVGLNSAKYGTYNHLSINNLAGGDIIEFSIYEEGKTYQESLNTGTKKVSLVGGMLAVRQDKGDTITPPVTIDSEKLKKACKDAVIAVFKDKFVTDAEAEAMADATKLIVDLASDGKFSPKDENASILALKKAVTASQGKGK
jgi:hypothetical protein